MVGGSLSSMVLVLVTAEDPSRCETPALVSAPARPGKILSISVGKKHTFLPCVEESTHSIVYALMTEGCDNDFPEVER